jgi:FkbH-like protein
VVLLATWTTRVLDAFIRVEGARHGFRLDVRHGAFGQFEQELLGDDWRGGDGADEVLVVAMRLEDLDPDLPHRFHADPEGFDGRADEVVLRIERLVELFRKRSDGAVLVASFSTPEPRPLGVFDASSPGSLTRRVQDLNRRLAESMSRRAGCHVWDYAGLVAEAGASEWTDPRLWTLGRIPVAARHQPRLGAHLARTLRAVLRPAAKCLVVDLDGVMWGGVIGDDGVGGILLGDDHPGLAYKEFQRAILGLRDRGILLAICSKNDEEVARRAIEQHPDMVVSIDDFAALRIDWNPKSQNLRAIAEELSIGLDSLVFFDDNPYERGEVEIGAPAVHVVPVPADAVDYVRALADVASFDVPTLTAEDRGRAASYRAERERQRGAEDAATLEEFLESLGMEATVGALSPLTSQRIAQLVAKTNQFNLTTRRQSQAELEATAASGDGVVVWLRLRDRHGDMGLVGVAVAHFPGEEAVLHNLVLSCRAANRGMEQTLVAHVAAVALDRGARTLVGEFIPSPRNHVVADLYSRLGFVETGTSGDGVLYRLDLSRASVDTPTYVRLEVEGAGPTL